MASGVSRLVRLRARSTIWIGVVTVIAAAAVVHAAASAADNIPAKAFRIPSAAMTSQTAIRRAISAATAAGFDTVEAIDPFADGAMPPDSAPLTSAHITVSGGTR